jgi:hypothetical protein
MRTASATMDELSNSRGAETCTNRTKTCTVSRLQEAVSELIYKQNPKKTWAFVADLFDLKERAAKHRLSNNSSYTIEELQVLFHDENGAAYLKAMMADAEPAWWKGVRASIALSEARVLQAEAQQKVLSLDNAPLEQPTRRKIKRFVDADRNLNAARAEKELAAGLLHQNASRSLDCGLAETKTAPAKRAYAGRGR